ncbi:hypothetical protein [Pseudobutyrivibrio xylanivorans]|uniref:Uncharacterized protein n=1 Tax=Pseudobutyrivibrio xylanivorans TaxID=185007 RepID=A0A5P6VSC5_PSEXY|nr:hypothetical protein [Pseudobutyrivibrio xylanivorans]QFJ55360.1 hypothetical protein FXF36_11050 [Pseudobutyrivibrio xylanivorans]
MDVKASSLNLTNKTVIPAKNADVSNNGKAVLGEKKIDACSVSFSREGTEKFKANSNTMPNKNSESYSEYVTRMDDILTKMAEGQALSSKEQQWLDSEVQNYASGQYDSFGGFDFKNSDILNKYLEDREAKEREYKRLTEELEADKALHDGSLFSHLKKEHDLQAKEDLIKALTESLHEEENFDTETDKQDSEADEVYFKDGFIDRYVEKEVQKMEESIGRDLKKSIKIGNGDEALAYRGF